MKILELKIHYSEMKNSLDGSNRNLDSVEENISELGRQSNTNHSNQCTERKKTKQNWNQGTEPLWHVTDNIK